MALAGSAKAEAAFADYVALGPGRTLRALADRYAQQNRYKTASTALGILSNWSVKYAWQQRIADASSARAEQLLREAADLDAETFLASSRLLNQRMRYATRDHADAIVKMRESVRKPQPKGASVNVNVQVQVQRLAEKLAAQIGVPAEELLAEAARVAEMGEEFQA